MQGTWALTLRSLRQDSRLLRFHLLRLGVASGLVLAVYLMWGWAPSSTAPGRDLLEALGWANFWAVSVAGVLLFAPTIAEEKEDQTLGLLRMTGIGPTSLLLGKALPKLLQLLLVLIVQLPLVWLTLTLGGVDWLLMTNVYLLVFGQLIMVVAISMLASTVMWSSLGAVALAGGLVLFWTLGFGIFARSVLSWTSFGIPFALAGPSLAGGVPGWSLVEMLDAVLRSGRNISGTVPVLAVNLSLAVVVVWLTAVTFGVWNRHEVQQTELEWVQEKWQRLWDWMTHFRKARPRAASLTVVEGQSVRSVVEASSTPDLAETLPLGRSRPSCRSWNNAVVWKDYFLLGGGRTGFRVRCGVAGLGVIGIIVTGGIDALLNGNEHGPERDHWCRYAGEAIMACSAWAFGLDLVYLTVNLFSYELRRQTWESLQLLPLSLGTICRRKILGAACHLIPWVVACLCGLAISISSDSLSYSYFWEYQMNDSLTVLGVVSQVVTQFTTCVMVLTWLSLRFNPWIAILLTGVLYWVIAVAWIISLFMVFGFMSPPGPYYQQVLFHVGWIGGSSLLGWGLLRSIRSTLRGEAASV